jgi:hypothetical protein
MKVLQTNAQSDQKKERAMTLLIGPRSPSLSGTNQYAPAQGVRAR